MTSTTGGSDAPSFGWIGRAAIASGKRQPHMNVFGGEDRFWLGPEGGQFALYFRPGDPFDLDHWQVPEPFDWDTWDIAAQSATEVRFRKPMTLVNYSRTQMTVDVDRTVRLLSSEDVTRLLGASPGSAVRTVAFESSNTVTNAGNAEWKPETGLVSVWILGMFNPSTDTTIVLPYMPGPESSGGPIVNDAYFGKVPADRLVITPSAVFFRGDGQYRSKIGLSPLRAQQTAASYDASGHVLTFVQYTRHGMAWRATSIRCGRFNGSPSRAMWSTAITMVRRSRARCRSGRSSSSRRRRPLSAWRPRNSTHTFTVRSTSSVQKRSSIAFREPRSESASMK
jgi:hypothetical protein